MTESQQSLLVADSFRVRVNHMTGQAEVRGWRYHLDRFREGVRSVCSGLTDPRLEGFFAEAAAAIRDYGEGFPRLELWHEPNQPPKLSFALRPLPPLKTEIELHTAPGVTLEDPSRKGPNIARLSALNRTFGGEALLVDRSGCVLEGATTSLIWWGRAPQTGYVVQDQTNRVGSVTERLLRNEASFTPGRIPPGNLEAHEVWAVNALHGIRIVTAIDGIATRKPKLARLKHFQAALDSTWQPVAT